MARLKIDYGIDLGTTNSAICRMEKGEPLIIKSDTSKDIVPSCVSFTRKKSVRVGDAAYNGMKSDKRRATKSWETETSNTCIEFKRTMATDTKYSSGYMGRSFSSEELSAEVLKTLKSFVTDESVSQVVITVPAKFTVIQKTATIEAATMAGFKRCELLQEPIAAAMAYGLTADTKDGIWMVFDFGGGTFDAALLRVEDGIMQVFDTEGDNYLGGKNLDYAIVDEIIIPYLRQNYAIDSYMADEQKRTVLRDAMKTYAEEVKNQLSFKDHEDISTDLGDLGEDEDGEYIVLDLTVTQDEAFAVMRPHFQKAVDICKTLLQRNNLTARQLDKLILVGGPTHLPLIRQMLREQITPNVDTSIDPMTAVAAGAALYASTIDAEVSDKDLTQDTVKLVVGYESTSVGLMELVSVQLDKDARMDSVTVELVSADKAWSSGRTEINKKGDVIEANLVAGRPNSFTVMCYDAKGNTLPCFPSEITIIQGSKVGAAPLPYNIGIAVWSDEKEKAVFRMARGLEKNKPVPATGVINNLKTNDKLSPGMESDTMRLPIYQVDDFAEAEGRPVSLYEHVGDILITGDDVDELIPKGSTVDVTLKVDSSEQMTMEVFFQERELTVEKVLDTSKKQSTEEAKHQIADGLNEAQRTLRRLNNDGIDTTEVTDALGRVREEAANSAEQKMVLQHLKEVLRKIEDLSEGTEWQRLEKELRTDFARLEKAQDELGDKDSGKIVEQLRNAMNDVIRNKDVNIGRELSDQIDALYYKLTMVYQCMGWIRRYDRTFDSQPWSDSRRARQLIDRGLALISNEPKVDDLRPIVVQLFDLLPDDERPGGEGLLS